QHDKAPPPTKRPPDLGGHGDNRFVDARLPRSTPGARPPSMTEKPGREGLGLQATLPAGRSFVLRQHLEPFTALTLAFASAFALALTSRLHHRQQLCAKRLDVPVKANRADPQTLGGFDVLR